MKNTITRRKFLTGATKVGTSLTLAATLLHLSACSGTKPQRVNLNLNKAIQTYLDVSLLS